MLINLTPYPVILRTRDGAETIIPSRPASEGGPAVALCAAPGTLEDIDGVPVPVVTHAQFTDVAGLPPEQPGVYLIVSTPVGEALRGMGSARMDILCPDRLTFRDPEGNVDRIARLVRPWPVSVRP